VNTNDEYPQSHINKTIEQLIATATSSMIACTSACDLSFACPVFQHYIRDRNEELIQRQRERATAIDEEQEQGQEPAQNAKAVHLLSFQSTDVIEQQMDHIHLKLFMHHKQKQKPQKQVSFSFFLCVFFLNKNKNIHQETVFFFVFLSFCFIQALALTFLLFLSKLNSK
jgi:hypothetical protein